MVILCKEKQGSRVYSIFVLSELRTTVIVAFFSRVTVANVNTISASFAHGLYIYIVFCFIFKISTISTSCQTRNRRNIQVMTFYHLAPLTLFCMINTATFFFKYGGLKLDMARVVERLYLVLGSTFPHSMSSTTLYL